MITGLQLALAAGALIGLGVALLVWRLAPAEPDLADALNRLSPDHTRRAHRRRASAAPDGRERLGAVGDEDAARRPLGDASRPEELAILRITLGPVLRREGPVRRWSGLSSRRC